MAAFSISFLNECIRTRRAPRFFVDMDSSESASSHNSNDEGQEQGALFKIPLAQLASMFCLTYAITYDSSQARTLYGPVRLTQTDHKHMSLRRLIVGLGRAPDGADVEVE